MSSTEPEQLLTVDQVAEMLQVPKATLYGWRYHHQGPPGIKVGRYVRYRRQAVDKWLIDNEQKPY
jgi:excisionase family DNA binding protein